MRFVQGRGRTYSESPLDAILLLAAHRRRQLGGRRFRPEIGLTKVASGFFEELAKDGDGDEELVGGRGSTSEKLGGIKGEKRRRTATQRKAVAA
jgi:hypothetical protein